MSPPIRAERWLSLPPRSICWARPYSLPITDAERSPAFSTVFLELFRGDLERCIGRRHSGIDGDLQKQFFQIAQFEIGAKSGTHVKGELFPPSLRRGDGQNQQ